MKQNNAYLFILLPFVFKCFVGNGDNYIFGISLHSNAEIKAGPDREFPATFLTASFLNITAYIAFIHFWKVGAK